MNNSELDSILKKARLPEASPESLELFPRRVMARLKTNDPPPRAARSFSPHLAWAFGLAVCAVIAFAAGHWRGRMETETIAAADPLAKHQSSFAKRWRCFPIRFEPLCRMKAA